MTNDLKLGNLEIIKYQENLKISSFFLPKRKYFEYWQKIPEKWKFNVSRSALFHMKRKFVLNILSMIVGFYINGKEITYLLIWASLNYLIADSSTGNFLSPISVSDWLIFCCSNSRIHPKGNEDENSKTIFDEKQQNYAKKVFVIVKWHSLLSTRLNEPWCNMLEARDMQKYRW